MKIKKNGKTINLSERDIKILKKELLREQQGQLGSIESELESITRYGGLEKEMHKKQGEISKGYDDADKKKFKALLAKLSSVVAVGEQQEKKKEYLLGVLNKLLGGEDTSIKKTLEEQKRNTVKFKKDGEIFNLTETDIKILKEGLTKYNK